jgi:4-hydroxybenzoate polyprenyltransferase
MRLDRPNGYWYFWYPHVFGTLWAAIERHSSLLDLVVVNFILIWGVLFMRGATCTWNDTVDVEFDKKVSRCRSRPIARGAVSIFQANLFTAAQTVASLAVLMLLPPVCSVYAIPAIVGWFCYPLAKRVTYYPQVVLGFPMAWGVYVGAASMGADPLHFEPLLDSLVAIVQHQSASFTHMSLDLGGSSTRPSVLGAIQGITVDWPITAFYVANVLWTLLYELVYSHQDAAEDSAAGVKNLVLLYERTTSSPHDSEELALHGRFGTMPLLRRLAILQVLFLAIAGAMGNFGFGYSTISVAGTAAALSVMLSRVRLAQPESCAWWFRVGNSKYAGQAMGVGLLLEYAAGFIGS